MKKKMSPFYLISAAYIVISIVLGVILLDGLVIFLAWNMTLATVVFFLSDILAYLFNKKVNKIIIAPVFILWVIFFPNSIYILTDFIHFQNYSFFQNYSDIYNFEIENWLVFTHITIGAIYAAKMGIESIKNIEDELKKITKKYYFLFLSALFILSSIAIFIGRFLRFNSWNFFQVFRIIRELMAQGLFMYEFIALFIIIHWSMYFLFSSSQLKRICER